VTHTHTFAVCAYKESPYLRECLDSIMNQTVKTNVILCTSTPSDFLRQVAADYGLELKVRDGKSDIRDDWNFAYDSAKTDLVTVAHQDDVYLPGYASQLLKSVDESEASGMPVDIYFTDYKAYKNGEPVRDKNSAIRKFLRWPLKIKRWSCSKFIKRRVFSLGNVVCCPSVTYNKTRLGDSVFVSEYKFNIDWDTFRILSYRDGRFLYNPTTLLYYRVHDGATSAEFIKNNGRFEEDLEMFRKFWPYPIARAIMLVYPAAYKTYDKL